MNIEELVNKYFEGETSCNEERELRHLFTRGIVPEHLEMYRPLFAFFEEENLSHKRQTQGRAKAPKKPLRRYVLYSLSGVAAGLLLLLGIAGIHRHYEAMPENYVIIDGKQYTDAKLVHEQAKVAFQSVSISEEELFSTLFE